MAKGPSKADLILSEARERVARAQQTVDTAEGQLGIALASLNAHQMAYDTLLKALTPKPRKKKEKEAAKADAPKSNGQLCTAMLPGLNVECSNREDNGIHDPNGGYGGYHPFESSAPVVERKSRRKSAAANSIQNSETNSEGALAVGASGD